MSYRVMCSHHNKILLFICREEDMEGRLKYAKGLKYELKDWFYGKITRSEAENWLSRLADHGDFLVRQSETNVSSHHE